MTRYLPLIGMALLLGVLAPTWASSAKLCDVMARDPKTAIWTGDGVYADMLDLNAGAKQFLELTYPQKTLATALVRIKNTQTVADSFTMFFEYSTSSAGAKVFDAVTGGKDITTEFTSGKYTTGTLQPGATKDLRVEIPATALPTAPGAVLFLQAYSDAFAKKQLQDFRLRIFRRKEESPLRARIFLAGRCSPNASMLNT
jgi:hypothetical protein